MIQHLKVSEMENDVFHDIEEGEILDGDMDSPTNLDNECAPLSSYWEKVPVVKDSIDRFHGPKGFPNERPVNNIIPYDQKWSHPMLPHRDIVPNLSLIGDYKLEPPRSRLFITSSNSHPLAYHKGNLSEKHKDDYLGVTDGMAEDIMSQIDQVVCRKKSSDHRMKKSKDYKYRWEMPYERKKCLYDLRAERKYSIKRKKRHDKCKVCLHDLNLEKAYDEDSTRKKRLNHKKSNLKTDFSNCYYDENTKTTITDNPNKHIRDFDQVRKDLLEKLQKQKLEKSKLTDNLGTTQTTCMENSKDQDASFESSSNKASAGIETNNLHPLESSQSEPDEELDLAHLRLMALTSNRKKKPTDVEDLSQTEKSLGDIDFFSALEPEPCQTPKLSEKPLDDSDIDRNELLLRAEALKTALLKKHQKRLNKANGSSIVKSEAVDGSDIVAQAPDSGDGSTEVVFLAEKPKTNTLATLVDDAPPELTTLDNFQKDLQQETATDKGSFPQKRCAKNAIGSNSKIKKKKKRPSLNLSHVKENEGQGCPRGEKEAGPVEEDCQHLRNQLLCDLIRKKSSPKSPKSKSVLLDSIQRPASKIEDIVVNLTNIKPYLKASKSSTVVNNSGRAGKLTTASAVPKPEIQRVIVHLGSDDSSDDDLDEESPKKEPANSLDFGGAPTEKEPQANEIGASGTKAADQDFGDNCKKVMLLLGEARKQVEEQQKARESKLAATEAIYKHLPLSQRLEYFRLKQKIAERERERRRMKRVAGKLGHGPTTAQSLPQNSLPAPRPAASTPADPSKRLKKTVTNTRFNSTPNSHPESDTVPRPAPTIQSNPTRVPSNQTLISKLKFLLKKVKIEKTIEENYEKEIAKLKGQLMLFEKRKNEQRFKIKRLVEESVKTYNQIAPLATAKPTISVSGPREKKPESEAPRDGPTTPTDTNDLRKDPNDSNVEVNGGDAPTQISKEGIGLGDQQDRKPSTTTVDDLIRYSSPLEALTLGSGAAAERLDPNAIMCQFDIAGVCRDQDCAYQHCKAK